MSKLILESETLINFMGCKNLKVEFDEKITMIYGDNGVGKSRLEDAYNWCLFGKNSAGKTDFPIKDTKNPEMHQADHEVSLVFKKNGFKENPKRILRQKYNKEGEYIGNDTICYWNDVQIKVGEFNMKVDAMIKEQVFRMISNVNFFNDDSLTPKSKRRTILVDLVGGFLSDEEVATGNKDFQNLLVRLAEENKSIEELEKQVKQGISRLNDDISKIQPAIDEITRNMPEEKNWKEIEDKILSNKSRIAEIDGILQKKSTALDAINSAKQTKQLELHKLKTKINDIRFDVTTKVKNEINESSSGKNVLLAAVASKQQNLNNLKSNNTSVQEKEQNLKSKTLTLEGRERNVESLKLKISGLTDRWLQENQKQMPDVVDTCPSCNQLLPEDNIETQKETIKSNWNKHLLAVKSEIEDEGKRYNTEIKQEQELIETIKSSIIQAQKELDEAKDKLAIDIKNAEKELDLANLELSKYIEPTAIDADAVVLQRLSVHPEYIEHTKAISKIEEELAAPEDKFEEDNAGIKEEKSTLQTEVDELNKILGLKVVIEQNKARIEEHNNNGKIWAAELTKLQGSKNTIQEFNRAKITSLEERINAKFQFTKFRMFKVLVNGELEDDCEAIYGDRPYSALNTADKINCGLDIINTLSTHYDISAPIFIDNRESIVKLIPVHSQTIQMIVSGDDKVLRVI